MPRVIASIEARMGSSRLPGKVLADIRGQPVLSRILRRLEKCRSLDGVVLATSDSATDDELSRWAQHEGVECYRGSEKDVLHRVVGAHSQMGTEVVVELMGDGPLLDHEVVDLGVETFLANDCDVVANTWKPSFPMGIDVQVYRLADLVNVEKTVLDPAVREHVSLYFYEHPDEYRILHLMAPNRWRAPELRLLLDYEEDLALITEIYRWLEPIHGDGFGIAEILELIRRQPELREINRYCVENSRR